MPLVPLRVRRFAFSGRTDSTPRSSPSSGSRVRRAWLGCLRRISPFILVSARGSGYAPWSCSIVPARAARRRASRIPAAPAPAGVSPPSKRSDAVPTLLGPTGSRLAMPARWAGSFATPTSKWRITTRRTLPSCVVPLDSPQERDVERRQAEIQGRLRPFESSPDVEDPQTRGREAAVGNVQVAVFRNL